MSVSLIREKIAQKVGQLQSLKAVYDYETSNPDGNYPFATVTLRGGEAEFGSTSHNVRRRRFRVRVYQERTKVGQGPENAEEIATAVLDELETAFDMDTTLSGSCKWVTPIGWEAGYIDREHDSRILEVALEATDVVESDYHRP